MPPTATTKTRKNGDTHREASPGRAIPQLQLRFTTGGSPPPVDPSEDLSSFTTETATFAPDDDIDREWSASPASLKYLRKHRKRVTFDVDGRRVSAAAFKQLKAATPIADTTASTSNGDPETAESLAQAVVDLSR